MCKIMEKLDQFLDNFNFYEYSIHKSMVRRNFFYFAALYFSPHFGKSTTKKLSDN